MVDQDGLENRFTRKGNVGSNPTLTAIRSGRGTSLFVPRIRSRVHVDRPRGIVVLSLLLIAGKAAGSEPTKGPEIRIARAAGPITIDGELDDPGWQGAMRVDTWYETNPGDNLPAKLKNVGYLAYDDKFLYAGFSFADPNPSKIRAPFADRDNVSGSSTDYGGLILDTRGEAKNAILFLATPRGIQYDAFTDDSSSEDSSPDWHWEAAGKITKEGWQLEIRIPFSSLRYPKADLQKWNVLLYRNYPRDFRYQMFSAKLPRDENCFICHSNPLAGLQGLPRGGNLIVAPYVTAKEEAVPRDGTGSPLVNQPVKVDGGLDVKWTPNAVTAIDGTINPDFSQVESDVAQLTANQRFALLYPEKRPFFLEGIDLFATPIQAVYTRTITAPRWGARVTGKLGGTSYTALVTEDKGGGSVILPGPNGSELRRSGLQVVRGGRPRPTRFRQLLREPSRRRPRNSGRRVQPGSRPGLPVAPDAARHPPGADSPERLGDAEPARPRRGVGRAKALRARGRRVGLAQRRGLRRPGRVQGLREGVSRRRRVRPAGGVPGRLLRDRVHDPADQRADQPLQGVPDRRLPGRNGRSA